MNEQIFKVGGVFTFEQVRDGKVVDTWTQDNIVVDEGLNYLLNSSLVAATPITTQYLGVFKNNYTPLAANVASTFTGSGVANEATTEYSESTRPVWNRVTATAKVVTNTASPATFTFASGVTLYGAFLVSTNTKGGTTGTLIAASKFSSARVMLISDVLNVTYSLTISST